LEGGKKTRGQANLSTWDGFRANSARKAGKKSHPLNLKKKGISLLGRDREDKKKEGGKGESKAQKGFFMVGERER